MKHNSFSKHSIICMEGSDSTVYNYDYGNPFYESRQNPRN